MIGAQIKVGRFYAMSEVARKAPKGGKVDLFSVGGVRRVRVLEKNVERLAIHADEGDGAYKRDGVRVEFYQRPTEVNNNAGNWDAEQSMEGTGQISVVKARDFLMPWDTYLERKITEQKEARLEAEGRRDRAANNIIRVERIKVILDSYGIDNDDILVGSGEQSTCQSFRPGRSVQHDVGQVERP
jgi:hypothetical protein